MTSEQFVSLLARVSGVDLPARGKRNMIGTVAVCAGVHCVCEYSCSSSQEIPSSSQVSLKVEEKELEHLLKGQTFVGSILAAGLP